MSNVATPVAGINAFVIWPDTFTPGPATAAASADPGGGGVGRRTTSVRAAKSILRISSPDLTLTLAAWATSVVPGKNVGTAISGAGGAARLAGTTVGVTRITYSPGGTQNI